MTPAGEAARVTPYEIGIPGRSFGERVFGAIRAEGLARGIDLTDPGAFLLLGEVGRAIREIQGDERGGEPLQLFGAFLFHAFHFNAAGELLFVLTEGLARELVERTSPAGWSGELPGRAGYLQLPRHLFWSETGATEAPEPVDGVFWTRSSRETLSLLAVLGMMPGRPGVSLVELPAAPVEAARAWPTQVAREESADFASTLPGGDLGRLYSVTTVGEVQKLVGKFFAYVEGAPDAVEEEERAPREQSSSEKGPAFAPSALPFRRVVRVEPDPGGASSGA